MLYRPPPRHPDAVTAANLMDYRLGGHVSVDVLADGTVLLRQAGVTVTLVPEVYGMLVELVEEGTGHTHSSTPV